MLLLVVVLTVAVPPGYAAAWERIPERHRTLVRSIHVDRDSGGQARRATMSIHLTPRSTAATLWHEVGHLVRWSDPELAAAWDRRFWPDGRLRGVPPSRYARTSPSEDLAESYEEMIEHGCLEDPDRSRFMLSRVLRPNEVPPCEAELKRS